MVTDWRRMQTWQLNATWCLGRDLGAEKKTSTKTLLRAKNFPNAIPTTVIPLSAHGSSSELDISSHPSSLSGHRGNSFPRQARR